MAGVCAVTACAKDEPRKRKGLDGPPVSLLWVPALRDAAHVVATGPSLLGEWQPLLAAAPAPPELRAIDPTTGEWTQRDRGWILHAGPSPNDAVIVDEQEEPLTYAIRTFSRPASEAVPLPQPDEGTWPLRGVACAQEPSYCAVVRWAPPRGITAVERGKPERLAITTIDAGSKSVRSTYIIESLDRFAGTSRVGGVFANPTRPDLYIVEWEPSTPATGVLRCIDLRTGDDRWRIKLPDAVTHYGGVGEHEFVPTADGSYVVVLRGGGRWGSFSPTGIDVINADTGVITSVAAIPHSWNQVRPLRDLRGPSIVALQVTAVRHGMGESPEYYFHGVVRFDAATQKFSDILDTAEGVSSPEAVREIRRREIPEAGIMVAPDRLVLVPRGGNTPSPQDTTPASTQQRRKEAVDLMLPDW